MTDAGRPAQILGWAQEFLAALTGPAVTMGALWLALTFPSGEVTHGVRFIASVCMFGMVCTELAQPRRRGEQSQPRQFAIVTFGCFAAALVVGPRMVEGYEFLPLLMVCGLLEPWGKARRAFGVVALVGWGALVATSGHVDARDPATLVVVNLAVAQLRGGAAQWMRILAALAGANELETILSELFEETSLRPTDLSWSEYPVAPPDGAEALLIGSALIWACIWVLKAPPLAKATPPPRGAH